MHFMINYTYQAFLQENMSPPLSYRVAHESNVFILNHYKKINTNQNDHCTAVCGIFYSYTEYNTIPRKVTSMVQF